jgi:ATP-dependent Lon protease
MTEYKNQSTQRNTMPVNISTLPKKKVAKSKKQEDASRTYKNNVSGPDPNAPQPPSPDSDVTDNDADEHAVVAGSSSAASATATTPSSSSAVAADGGAAAAAAGTAAASNEEKQKGKKSQSQKSQKDESYDRLEVNRLLSDLFPSTYMNEKLKQLEAGSAAKKTKSATTKSKADDAIINAIIENAFSGSESPVPLPSSTSTPSTSTPSTPPPTSALTTTPMAPKKAAAPSKKKEKQNFNIIIHVEPKSKGQGQGQQIQRQGSAIDNISRRLDFGKKKGGEITENDDDSDEDYIPEDSDDEDEYYEDDDDEYEDDDEYDDDSCYSSSSDDDEDDCDTAEMETLQKKYTEELAMLQSLRATYEEMLTKDKTNRVVAKQLKTLKESEEKIKKELDDLTYKQKRKNSKKFRKLLRRKSSTNDLDYFKKHLTIQQQRALITEMNEVAKVTAIDKPYKLTLLESDIPRDMKAVALRKVGMLQYMEPGCGEYCKLKNWVDAFMQIPFSKNKNLPITISDGVERCHEFMTCAKTRLDTAVYGLNDAKMQIMQMVGQWIANPAAIGTAVAIHGPPGTGKTSLVKEGISKILGRDFAFIALGGATDSSFLEGHSYTYEGSMWGKIVDILIRCKSSNPVIYFDELDKISETSKGEEIVGILTHLTDTSQNSQFHDKYFSEVGFDLSKCLFIFSYNDESRVNPVLLDRMYKIKTTGYSTKDKTFIAQHHLIPRIRAEVAFEEGDIIIPDSVVEYIVENHTLKEAGVRNLKRCLETVYTKLNLHRLMRPGTQLFDDKETSLEVSFPYTVSREVVDKLIKKNETDRPNMNLYL